MAKNPKLMLRSPKAGGPMSWRCSNVRGWSSCGLEILSVEILRNLDVVPLFKEFLTGAQGRPAWASILGMGLPDTDAQFEVHAKDFQHCPESPI